MSNTFSVFNPAKNAQFDLGKGNWFFIQKGDGDYRSFKMTEWTEDELTEFVFFATASSNYTSTLNKNFSRALAQALLEWAGDDTLVAVDEGDNAQEVAERFGMTLANELEVTDRFGDVDYGEYDELSDAEIQDEKKAILRGFDQETEMWASQPLPSFSGTVYRASRDQMRKSLVKSLNITE